MRKVILLCLGIALAATSVQAQFNSLKKNAEKQISSQVSPGTLLTQFSGALKPTSFITGSSDQKSKLLSSFSNISSASQFGSGIGSLASLIKPSMFKSGFNLSNILKLAKTIQTIRQGADLLKSLEGGLKPEAFTKGWSQKRTGWLTALNALK